MAKRGIVFYMSFVTGFGFLGYLFFKNYSTYKNLDPEKMYLEAENTKKLITTNEIRLMAERNRVENVPEADQEKGYM